MCIYENLSHGDSHSHRPAFTYEGKRGKGKLFFLDGPVHAICFISDGQKGVRTAD